MKFLLFRILLLHRTRDRGFTLPMVVGIGLIMVLLGSMSLVQSSEENLNTISKNQSSTSLAMAELGVARYRELLNNNRVLAVYNLDNWTDANVAAQTCNDVSGAWVDTDNWFDITLDEFAQDFDFNGDGDKNDNELVGSAKIVNYVYQNDTNPGVDNGVFDQTSDVANRTDPLDPTTGPRGILTVQGQAPNSDSVAQIQVTIPIGVNTEDLNTLDPGIWIHQSVVSPTDLGDIEFRDSNGVLTDLGNLVLYRNTTGDNRCTDVAGLVDIRDPRDLPPLATSGNPISFNGNIDTNTASEPKFNNNELILGKDYQDQQFLLDNPEFLPVEDSDGEERYYAQVTGGDLVITDGQSLLTDGKAKVVVIVNGNLTISDNVEIGNTSSAAKSNSLEIHVNGNVDITSTDGTVNINALIRSSGIVSIGATTEVNLKGSIWAEGWDNDGEVNVIRDLGQGEDAYKYYSITSRRTPKPLTYAPTGWQTQEAN